MKTTKKLVDTLEENGIVYAYGVDFDKCKAEIKEAEDAEDFVKKYKELVEQRRASRLCNVFRSEK